MHHMNAFSLPSRRGKPGRRAARNWSEADGKNHKLLLTLSALVFGAEMILIMAQQFLAEGEKQERRL